MIKSLTVSEFVNEIRQTVRQSPSLKNVALVGEISNFNPHHSGHFYFTLKDQGARLDCVMFSSHTKTLLFKPKNGDKIVIQGYADVYVAAGKVQFYAHKMNLDGLGDLHIRYEALKKKFYEAGVFSDALKKPIPKYPEKIAIITGKDSAAYADINKTIQNRWPLAQRMVYFTYVQGELALPTILSALKHIETQNVDVIILARGGGSIEDLWAFNEEALVHKIVSLNTPIVCAIGHESDTTLSELASDYRAATPTDAAVVCTPHQNDVYQGLRDYKNNFYLKTVGLIKQNEIKQSKIIKSGYLANPNSFFAIKQLDLDYMTQVFHKQNQHFRLLQNDLSQIIYQMQRALTQKTVNFERNIVTLKQKNTDAMHHKISSYKSDFNERMIKQSQAVDYMKQISSQHDLVLDLILKEMSYFLKQKRFNFESVISILDQQSPLKKMSQGYLYASKDGEALSSVKDLNEGDLFSLRFIDGIIKAKMIEKEVDDGKL